RRREGQGRQVGRRELRRELGGGQGLHGGEGLGGGEGGRQEEGLLHPAVGGREEVLRGHLRRLEELRFRRRRTDPESLIEELSPTWLDGLEGDELDEG